MSQSLRAVLDRSIRPWVWLSSSAIGLFLWVGVEAVQGQPSAAPTPTLSSPAANVPAPNPVSARPTLRLGSQGYPVTELQAMLKLLGYYSGAVDGQYRQSTAIAVSAFQQAAGLQVDGIVGSDTWSRLLPIALPTAASTPSASPTPTASQTPSPAPAASQTSASPTPAPDSPPASVDLPILRLGMRGSAVARLQERLRATGFFEGAIDGVFGAETQAAVRAAQSRYRLEADGVVGAATWAALLR